VGAERIFVAQIGPRVHKVSRGETLGQVARKHGINLRTLAALNGLETNAKLKRGRVLKLPEERPATLADLAARSTGAASADSSL
jgi:LysM repeat protein